MKICHLFFTVLSIFICRNLFSQTGPTKKELKKATYIFEGIIQDIVPFKENEKQYISYKISVIKVLNKNKDFIVGDTVEIVSIIPQSWGVIVNTNEIYHRIDYHPKSKSQQLGLESWLKAQGVFFTEKNNIIRNELYFPKISMTPTFKYSSSYYAFVPEAVYNKEFKRTDIIYSVSGFGNVFSNIETFNDYLEKLKLQASSMINETVEKRHLFFK